MTRKELCRKCGEEKPYNEICMRFRQRYGDHICSFDGKVAICAECGHEIYSETVEDYNLGKWREVYERETAKEIART